MLVSLSCLGVTERTRAHTERNKCKLITDKPKPKCRYEERLFASWYEALKQAHNRHMTPSAASDTESSEAFSTFVSMADLWKFIHVTLNHVVASAENFSSCLCSCSRTSHKPPKKITISWKLTEKQQFLL